MRGKLIELSTVYEIYNRGIRFGLQSHYSCHGVPEEPRPPDSDALLGIEKRDFSVDSL